MVRDINYLEKILSPKRKVGKCIAIAQNIDRDNNLNRGGRRDE